MFSAQVDECLVNKKGTTRGVNEETSKFGMREGKRSKRRSKERKTGSKKSDEETPVKKASSQRIQRISLHFNAKSDSLPKRRTGLCNPILCESHIVKKMATRRGRQSFL